MLPNHTTLNRKFDIFIGICRFFTDLIFLQIIIKEKQFVYLFYTKVAEKEKKNIIFGFGTNMGLSKSLPMEYAELKSNRNKIP